MDSNENDHFRKFASGLEAVIARYETDSEETLIERQRRQIKLLISLEGQFRKTLIDHPWGVSSYRAFMEMILDDKQNILAARPYFRERQGVFAAEISKALKQRNDKGLYKFKINYPFIHFILNNKKWTKSKIGSKIVSIAKQIDSIRTEIMEQNLPLAISQARIFYSSTPKSHLSYMDLIQIHAGGLLAAIDKFVPPDTSEMTNEEELEAYRKFRAVIIGRVTGDRIHNYSETLIHFYPSHRRKIYRALKAKRRLAEGDVVDYEKLSERVNEGVENKNHLTNSAEIAQLVSAASCVSGDISLDLDGETTLDRTEDEFDKRPDNMVEEIESVMAVKSKYKELSVLERKLLNLKGIST
jgi:DNA-directed RNA polymerase specialized sigma subunit